MTQPSPAWRAVYFIQRLISWVAPPLHSLHWKIFALLLVGLFLPAVYFLWQVQIGIERSHLRSTELGMIDTALVLADSLQSSTELTTLPAAREIKRRVFDDNFNDLRVVLYDKDGRVLSDSDSQLAPGTDASAQKDVAHALAGRHGARWVRDPYRKVVTLFSTVPYFRNNEIAGAIGIIKPTADVRRSILRSLKDLALPALLAFGVAAATSYLLSNYLTRVITGMAGRAHRIADGEPGVRLETWTKSELGDLARALEAMRRKLEGKAYVEEMASTLSHELKTPLASIRGAAEIAQDTDSPEVRKKFLTNILAETDRLTGIVNNLLALSRIETQPAEAGETCRLDEVARETAAVFQTRAETLGLHFHVSIAAGSEPLPLSAEQLRRVLEILLDNAFAFTPSGKNVHLETTARTATVRDEGPGMTPEVQARVFERFFTTVNPLTGRRGTGLGLAIAQSIITRAHGTITLQSAPGQGTEVTVSF
ncbi:MAG: ATP-binding protein [Terrimicrobiaceae bacterium]